MSDLTDHADTLVDFAEDPLGFIQEYVYIILADGFLSALEGLMGVIWTLWYTVRDVVFGKSGSALLESFAAIGSIPFLLLRNLNEMLVLGAQAGGPFAPLIYAFAWSVLIIIVVEALRLAWRSFVVIT